MPNFNCGSKTDGVIRIQLKSDLCVASGDGFSSGIDTDVCYDERGLPYIPARRLKGCLREAATFIGMSDSVLDAIFGVNGASQGGNLRISNAVLLDPADSDHPITPIRAADKQAVLDLFTYTRAQTALENDSAKDGSLRFTRVVRHYYPRDFTPGGWREMSFQAKVQIGSQLTGDLGDACKALRNIGMGRNRGLGAVKCSFLESENTNRMPEGALYRKSTLEDGRVLFEYAVRLDSPVMVPQGNGGKSIAFIPGTAVLGYFASKLKENPRFGDLFLRDCVRYSPLYPISTQGERCRPASALIVKAKGGSDDGMYFNAREALREPVEGAAFKPLKEGFVDGSFMPVEVETEIVYHHRTDEDATLYTQECLKSGQVFGGFIDVSPQVADLAESIQSVLDMGVMYLGRSKTAQYARCSLVEMPSAASSASHCDTLAIEAGKDYALLCDSDIVLLNDCAHYSTDYRDLKKALLAASDSPAWWSASDAELDESAPITNLRYRTVTGYNAKWNQKKPHIRVIAAGSCLVVRAERDAPSFNRFFYIGERQAEGYGRVEIVPLDEVNPAMRTDCFSDKTPSEPNDEIELSDLLSRREQARSMTIAFARLEKDRFAGGTFGPSFVGRLTRMAEQSSDQSEFAERVASVKTDSKRKAAIELFEKLNQRLDGFAPIDWSLEQECIVLLLTLGKYFAKQISERDA